MSSPADFKPVNTAVTAPKDFNEVLKIQSSLLVPHFTALDAWTLGCALRTRLIFSPKPCVVSIALPSGQPLFFCTSGSPALLDPSQAFDPSTIGSGTQLDNSSWVARKAKTVVRFGVPSYALHVKYGGDEVKFRTTFGMGAEEAGAYAIHGGAVPIKIKGVEAIVAVVVVSGLKQDEDHGVIVEVLGDWIKGL